MPRVGTSYRQLERHGDSRHRLLRQAPAYRLCQQLRHGAANRSKAPAGSAVMHHGDVRHAGDRIESGERLQLVAFFYGGERRGNALPMAIAGKPEGNIAGYGGAGIGASRVANARRLASPPSARDKAGTGLAATAHEPQRLFTLADVASLAKGSH